MSFQPDKLTTKTREAIAAAQRTASSQGHVEINSIHLLHALINEQSGVIRPLLKAAAIPLAQLSSIVDSELERLPRSDSQNTPGPNRELQTIFETSGKIMSEMGDEFISTEHLLLAMAREASPAKRILELNGVSAELITAAIAEVRGNATVTDTDPEGKYQVLQKLSLIHI